MAHRLFLINYKCKLKVLHGACAYIHYQRLFCPLFAPTSLSILKFLFPSFFCLTQADQSYSYIYHPLRQASLPDVSSYHSFRQCEHSYHHCCDQGVCMATGGHHYRKESTVFKCMSSQFMYVISNASI